jgi:hypothetical protein
MSEIGMWHILMGKDPERHTLGAGAQCELGGSGVPSGDPDAIDGGSPHRITDPVGRLCRAYG